MTIDVRGAILRGPTFTGFFQLEEPGFVHPDNLKLVPGVKANGAGIEIPANMVAVHGLAPKHKQPPSRLKLHEYQKEAVAFIHGAPRGALISLDVGCHPYGEEVVRWDGRVLPVQKIDVWDLLRGCDGKPRCVLAVREGTTKRTYKVHLKDKPSFTVTGDHKIAYVVDDDPTHENKDVLIYKSWNLKRARNFADVLRADNIYLPWAETPKKIRFVRVENVEEIRHKNPVPFRGFLVDHDNYYLLSNGVITHNCGKTIVSCQYAYECPDQRPILVVGPLAALRSWCGEHSDPSKHYGWRFHRIEHEFSEERAEALPQADGYFINYELCRSWRDHLKDKLQPRIVVVDEAHEIRNSNTYAYKALAQICYRARKRVILSATPIVNEICDLWTQLNLAQPKHWGWVIDFGIRYQNFTRGEYEQWVHGRETNVEELQQRLSNVLYHRGRFDMLKNLPPYERTVIEVKPEQLDPKVFRDYRDIASATARQFIAQGKKPHGLELQRAVSLLQKLSRAKWPAAVEAALTLCETNWKVVVWCWYTETAEYIAKCLADAKVEVFGPVHGKVNKKRRDKFAAGFRDVPREAIPNGAAFVTTVGTSGRAMNELVVSNCGLWVDLCWTPVKLLQSEGRHHRQGQTADCSFYYLIARNTVDDWMWSHLHAKAQAIISSGDREALTLTEQLGGSRESDGLADFFAAVAGVEGDGTL